MQILLRIEKLFTWLVDLGREMLVHNNVVDAMLLD